MRDLKATGADAESMRRNYSEKPARVGQVVANTFFWEGKKPKISCGGHARVLSVAPLPPNNQLLQIQRGTVTLPQGTIREWQGQKENPTVNNTCLPISVVENSGDAEKVGVPCSG